MYSHVQKLFGLDRNERKKKGCTTKQNPPKITQTPPSLGLFTFVVLLFIDVGVVVIIILFICFRKWLLSYAPLCPKNLKIRFITSPNGTAIKLTTSPLLTKTGVEHGFRNSSFLFLECPHYNFFFSSFLCSSLANFFSLLFLHGANY
jgi:hypothetical protein